MDREQRAPKRDYVLYHEYHVIKLFFGIAVYFRLIDVFFVTLFFTGRDGITFVQMTVYEHTTSSG